MSAFILIRFPLGYVWVGKNREGRGWVSKGWRQKGWRVKRLDKVNKTHQNQWNSTEWEKWRERWRQEWMEGGLAGVDRGMLPDQCKEGGVGQVSHQLQPWPSLLLLSLAHTLSAPFNHRSHPLVLPWSLSSPPINQSLLPPLPQALAHPPPPPHAASPLFVPPDSSTSLHCW